MCSGAPRTRSCSGVTLSPPLSLALVPMLALVLLSEGFPGWDSRAMINRGDSENGASPLHLAAAVSHKEMVSAPRRDVESRTDSKDCPSRLSHGSRARFGRSEHQSPARFGRCVPAEALAPRAPRVPAQLPAAMSLARSRSEVSPPSYYRSYTGTADFL